jgi:hypothetical protein
MTLPTAGNAILGTYRTNDGNRRGSVLGIISELIPLGGIVQAKHFGSNFEYSLGAVVPAAAA